MAEPPASPANEAVPSPPQAGRKTGEASPLKDGGEDKNEHDDVSEGPMKNRGCTDVWCLIVFLVHWAGFLGVTAMGFKDGNPFKLYAPRDYRGEYCGIKENWNNGLNLESHEKLIHMMNLTQMVSETAKQFVCSTAAEAELTQAGVLTPAELEKYMCACCKTPCESCQAVLGMEDFTSSAGASAATSSKMAELTDSSRMNSLYSATGANGGSFNDVYSQATKYFYQVCVTDCNVADYEVNATGWRSYVYEPPPDQSWRDAWETLRTNAKVSTAFRSTLSSSFIFQSLPESMCPYKAKYCVPMPGTSFKELTAGYCNFQVSANVLDAMGTTADALQVEEIKQQGYETLGSAMGDVIDSLDTFIIVCVLAFVNGFAFLIALRFAIKIFVYGSIFGVFVCFMGSGAACYVRSGQCSGTSFTDTGKNYGYVAATVATETVNGVTVTSDETIAGNGVDYRGAQTRTRGARTCQAWNSQSPHSQSLYATYSNEKYGLVHNYCRNPINSIYIWCYTNDPATRWELCDPIGVHPWDHVCPNGFTVPDEGQRKALEVFAYILWVFGLIWWLFVCCLWKRIHLAVELCTVAAQFLYQTPQIILVPIIQAIVCILWNILWAFCAAFILSQVADGYVPTDAYVQYQTAKGTPDVPGKCNDKWPTGYVWKYEGDALLENDSCSGNLGVTTATDFTPACWKCMPPRFMFDMRFAYSFFSYLWFNNFLIATGQVTIAGAVGVWFFAENGRKHKQASVCTGFRNAWRYHAGSIALGSFIIAVVQFIRYCLKYLEQQAKAQKNKVLVIVLKVVGYLIWCFEKCLKFITKNAFIQIALVGNNFCTSAKKAFNILSRNFVRFGVFAMLGGVINMLGIGIIVACTLFIGYYILMAMHSDISPVMPMVVFAMMSYVVAKIFMAVFHLACDAMMHCFIITEEMGLEKADKGVEFVPGPLRKLIPDKE